MGFQVKILADSASPRGHRFTTMECKYPRFIHSELMTHRMLSRNSASSRAIPVEKMLRNIEEDPVVPIHWGKNQAGMQAHAELDPVEQVEATEMWLMARDSAVRHARALLDLGLHKQIVNRIVEPWMWITVIVSATEWENFFNLRVHPDAEPHFQKLARMMRDALVDSKPAALKAGEWHLPLYRPSEDDAEIPVLAEEIWNVEGIHHGPYQRGGTVAAIWEDNIRCRLSVGRCARVSYLTHDGRRDPRKDLQLHDDLKSKGHWSPFEHVARALGTNESSGNLIGFDQYRKTFRGEDRGPVK